MKSMLKIFFFIFLLFTSKSYAGSFAYLLDAARQGDVDAQFEIGTCYFNGRFVYKDDTQAKYWLEKAAQSGNCKAQYKLGYFFDINEFGPAKDPKQAVHWYRKSAEAGCPEAQYALANCLRGGFGEAKNFPESFVWYGKAASNGFPLAIFNYASCYYNGDGINRDFEEALKWYKIGAEKKEPNCMLAIGNCYRDGVGVDRDKLEAIRWWIKASSAGSKSAAYTIDHEINQLISCSEKLDPINAYVLGKCYQEGLGINSDNQKARDLFQRSAEQDYAPAQFEYGLPFIERSVESRNPKEALEWLTKAADAGNNDAINALKKYAKELQSPNAILENVKKKGVTKTDADMGSIDLLFREGEGGGLWPSFFRRFIYNIKNPVENALYTIPADFKSEYRPSIKIQNNLKIDEMFEREFMTSVIMTGYSSDNNGLKEQSMPIWIIDVLNEYFDRYKKWNAIAKENTAGNFIKTFEGKDVVDFWERDVKRTSLRDLEQIEVYFEWLDGEGYIDIKDLRANKVIRNGEAAVDLAKRLKPLLEDLIYSLQKVKSEITNKASNEKAKIDNLFKESPRQMEKRASAPVQSPIQSDVVSRADLSRAFELADKELNVSYHKVMGRLNRSGQDRLKSAQRNWIKVKESQTKGDSSEALQKRLDMTIERNAELLEMLR